MLCDTLKAIYKLYWSIAVIYSIWYVQDKTEHCSLGTMTLNSCQRDSSFDSELCFDSEIRLAFENIFYSERVAVQSYPDLNDDAYSD